MNTCEVNKEEGCPGCDFSHPAEECGRYKVVALASRDLKDLTYVIFSRVVYDTWTNTYANFLTNVYDWDVVRIIDNPQSFGWVSVANGVSVIELTEAEQRAYSQSPRF